MRKAKAHNVEVIAVCLLHSYIQPEHEKKLAEIIKEEFPEARVVLSSDVLPRADEFARAATTALAAYVTPKVTVFLNSLGQSLKENGFRGALLVMTNNAGIETTEVAIKHADSVVGSSQSGGPLSALFFAELTNADNVIAVDIGGTSFDASVIPKRTIAMSTDNRIGDQLNAIESVSVDTIGAGGGSIAWLDPRCMLCIGPDSAGADPGPACYGKGGKRPTVTDADVLLGYIPADYFLGGKIKLDVNLAQQAIEEKIAVPMGIDVIEAAYLIRCVADSTMADRAFLSLVERGYDPGDFALFVAGGAAGPTHGFDLARHLGARQLYIPKIAPVFCTLGMLNADFRHDFMHVLYQIETELQLGQINKTYDRMEAKGVDTLESQGLSRESISIIRGADVRYYGQVTEVNTHLPERPLGLPFTKTDLQALIEAFHCNHNEERGYSDRTGVTQFVNLKLTAVGKKRRVSLPETVSGGEDLSGALKYRREIFFKKLGGFIKTPCYDGDRLCRGNNIKGPAVVEERATTIVVPPNAELGLDRYGNYAGKVPKGR